MRTEKLLALRSKILIDDEKSPLEIEFFQNNCIRPILKFQNEALLTFFRAQILDIKIHKTEKEIENFVRTRLQKDIVSRNIIIGMILGLMTNEELSFYNQNKSELSRRIINMVVQRSSGQLNN